MKTFAYNELYIDDAMDNVGVMMDFAINYLHLSPAYFFDCFLKSGIAEQISSGNPRYLVGHSGIELTLEVMERTGQPKQISTSEYRCSLHKEYWSGWILTYYQWQNGHSFEYLNKRGLDIDTILSLYYPLHEADYSKFTDAADSIIASYTSRNGNSIKNARKLLNISQQELANRTGISLRMIRAYEQGAQDLSKASYSTVMALAKTLNQDPEFLIS